MEDVDILDPTKMASKLQNCVLSVIVEGDDGEDGTNIGENLIRNVCEQTNVDEKKSETCYWRLQCYPYLMITFVPSE